MKFRSSSAGYITGVRFYKGSHNTGVHIGHLWSKGGTLLASAQFENESDSGWQQATFLNPVAISAGTTYVVSYQAPYGHYSRSQRGFSKPLPENGPLQALADGEDGANGIYKYGSGFPTNSHDGSNYWVDVVFDAAPATSLLFSAAKQTTFPGSALAAPAVEPTPAGRTLSCVPRMIHAGDEFVCEVRQSDGDAAREWHIGIEASSADVRVPASVQARANQRVVTFRGTVDAVTSQTTITISAWDSNDQAQAQISVVPRYSPVVSAPGKQFVRPGESLRFVVSTHGGADSPVQISTSELPAGALYSAATGQFVWTPSVGQEGEYPLTFTATNAAGYTSMGQTWIIVDSGKPVITQPEHLACAPESIATLNGRWLTQRREQFSDQQGASTSLGGTTVRINGTLAPVLFATQDRVDFLCPASPTAGKLDLVLETGAGSTTPRLTRMLEANPTLLSVKDQQGNYGLITRLETGRLAMVRDFHGMGEPAQRDDLVSIRASGLGGSITNLSAFSIKVGDATAEITQITAAPDEAGVTLIQVRIPAAAPLGDAVPVQLEMLSPAGQRLTSNMVAVAIE